MKWIDNQYQKRLNVLVIELRSKLKRQGYLSKSENNFLRLAQAMS